MSDKTVLGKPDLARAMVIDNQAEAEAFIETYARQLVEESRPGKDQAPLLTLEQGDELARFKVAYYAAIYSHMNLERVQKVFSVKHSVYQAPDEPDQTGPTGQTGPTAQAPVEEAPAPARKRARTEDVIPPNKTEAATQS